MMHARIGMTRGIFPASGRDSGGHVHPAQLVKDPDDILCATSALIASQWRNLRDGAEDGKGRGVH